MTTPTYTPGPASLFATAARSRTIQISAWCQCTGEREKHDFTRDEGKWEYYRCCNCGEVKRYAVR